ncbi:hypothetical protein CkaCkLH20_12756 [Colletotrichum karsti]|uniref:Major facilitator superfamily (MFS) profile domain-containing protein n=1 Tax=Colletotrichum karsti TaxID=1095194 RepID=A0A9P6LDX7_9PEZI|nr:uncharacterized protein CkaCkLH20_12756 [Colletotrichum karsti]KAF9869713.1 hypothetical protein CkaCkLH20_12756 [Colletotrichum karsti]
MPSSTEDTSRQTREVERTPGTIHLIDADGHISGKHVEGSGATRGVVLVPAPSKHPDDPLNWSPRRKKLAAFCMAFYVLVIGICSSALYSTLGPLSQATGLSYNDLNYGTGYMFLFLGWGCVFWSAVATQYGKRPIYLITLAGTLGTMVWQPHISTNGEWIAAKMLQGLFGAPMESIAEVTVSDIFFTHERGTYMAVYALALGYSNGIAPLIMGFINQGMGYQWVFYWCAIFCAIALVLLFFCMEETKFDRAGHVITAQNLRRPEDGGNEAKAQEDEEKKADANLDLTTSHVAQATLDSTIHKKSYFDKLKPIGSAGFKQRNYVGRLLVVPFELLSFSIIVYAGFLYGSNIIWLSVLNATESMILSQNPYNMGSNDVGLTFIAPLIGTTLAACFTGLFGDRFMLWKARRNGGTFEAEHRLWLFVPSLALIPFGCILYGLGAYHHAHWFAIVFAMGVISFTTTAGSQMSIAYIVDCYRDMSNETLAAVIFIRNTMSFGIGYAVTPWVTKLGYQNAFILGAFLGLSHNLTIFPVIRWGRSLRQKSANRYWRKVEKHEMAGLTH